jgi:hypothetical protein
MLWTIATRHGSRSVREKATLVALTAIIAGHIDVGLMPTISAIQVVSLIAMAYECRLFDVAGEALLIVTSCAAPCQSFWHADRLVASVG